MSQIKITQTKSSIKRLQSQKRTLEALGLRGIGKEVIHEVTPSILGMVDKVKHLVSVQKHKEKEDEFTKFKPGIGIYT